MGLGWFFQISQSLAELVQSHCFNQIRLGCDHPGAIHFLDLVSTRPSGETDIFEVPLWFQLRESHGLQTLQQPKNSEMSWPASPPLLFLAKLGEKWLRGSLNRMLALALEFLLADCSPSLFPHDPSGSTGVPSPLQSFSTGHLLQVWKPPQFHHFLTRAPKSQKFRSEVSCFCSSLLAL